MTASNGDGRLAGRTVALGITGSIAAYKAVELLRLLQAEGADVRVLMTPAATHFVAPLTLATLSRHPVDSDVLDLQADGRIGHIVSGDEADAIVVAPATAHWIAAMSIGLASDSITAACLAAECPVVVAPAMDGGMYAHPATQANVRRLRDEFGYRIVEPGFGALASGQVGTGRLAPLDVIVATVVDAVTGRSETGLSRRAADLRGRHVVVTAGGTAEPIDPVRYIGNRSTGKMGIAVAEAALARGAIVTLVAGHLAVAPPPGARVVRAETTEAMGDALHAALVEPAPGEPHVDALVMAAAVADFRPARPVATKLHRSDSLVLDLEPTPDLLAGLRVALADRADRPVLVGFAAETGELGRAADKLRSKGVDLIVANDVSEPGSGFGTDTNRVVLYAPDTAPEPWPQLSKHEVAERLLDRIVRLLESPPARRAAAPVPAQEVPS